MPKAGFDDPSQAIERMKREREVLAQYGLRQRPLLKRDCPLTEDDEQYIAGSSECEVTGFIYFAQCGDDGPIKIGYSSDPTLRAGTLQTAHHEELRLLCTLPGDTEDEARLHRRFKRSRIRGEWFRPSPSLVQFVRERMVSNGRSRKVRDYATGLHRR